jgi:hypothetical protein
MPSVSLAPYSARHMEAIISCNGLRPPIILSIAMLGAPDAVVAAGPAVGGRLGGGAAVLAAPPSLLVGLHLVEMQPGLLEVVVWGFRPFHPLGLLVVKMGALLKIFGRLLLCLLTQ